jgi:lipoprotein-anchoring transpeptidase ErfK/SrfK
MYVFMNTISRTSQARLAACLISIFIAIIWLQPVWGDSRKDAVFELDRLHQSSSDREMSDELKSADETFAIAEHFLQTNNAEQSERYYLLTIQKSRIILASPSITHGDSTPPSVAPPVRSTTSDILSPSPATTESDTAQQTMPVPDVDSHPSPVVVPDTPAVIQDVSIPPLAQGTEYFSDDIASDNLVGTTGTYSVIKSDTIRLIAAKLGVKQQHLIKKNRLDQKAYLRIGQKLRYNNRKIVPQRMKNGIVVNIPDRTLYYFKKGKLAVSLPVALGVPVKSDKYDWKTPTGKFRITAKMKDPTWHVPPSIQSEMEDHGKEVITSIPPGTSNPLGKFAFKTSIPGILIHSTTKPWSIYSFASHGCIRVYPEQMEEFFKEVKVNTPGEIIYKPVKLAVTDEGRVFLEVHRDVYGKSSSGLATEARHLIEKQNLSKRVDWQKVESIVRHTSGIAEDISL